MVTVAYSGVHQAYQLALAAQEANLLDGFYCSLLDAPGKWGRKLAALLGESALTSRRCLSLNPERVVEIPGPFLAHRLVQKISKGVYPWYRANFSFDAAVSRKLASSSSRVFVGTETCARDSFRAAKQRGMICVLDCPQVHPAFLTELLNRAADDLGVPHPAPFDPPQLAARKEEEFATADHLLVISEMQRRTFLQAGFSPQKLHEIQLWADPHLWFPNPNPTPRPSGSALQVLFVGSLELRKGIPYLLRAAELCGSAVELTLVGAKPDRAAQALYSSRAAVRYVGTKTKDQLRQTYWDADVLVLPSLVDTFGFVAMEAMACSCPVVVTENCGVAVPDTSWRVPVMDVEAIAERLLLYAEDRDRLQHDKHEASVFARNFTPERYRKQASELFVSLVKRFPNDSVAN